MKKQTRVERETRAPHQEMHRARARIHTRTRTRNNGILNAPRDVPRALVLPPPPSPPPKQGCPARRLVSFPPGRAFPCRRPPGPKSNHTAGGRRQPGEAAGAGAPQGTGRNPAGRVGLGRGGEGRGGKPARGGPRRQGSCV